MVEQEEKKVSKFSSGINILMRVDLLWKDTHNHSRAGRFQDWNDDLDRIWLELARDLKDNEYYDTDEEGNAIKNPEKENKKIKNGYKSQFDEFDEKLKSEMPFRDSGSSEGFGKPDDGLIKKRNKQYKILMEKQLFLARLENTLGKGTSWEEEEEYF